jgi:hypothetical protein
VAVANRFKDRIRIFVALGISTKLSRSFTAIMPPRLIWMFFADPTVIAGTFSFNFCHKLPLPNGVSCAMSYDPVMQNDLTIVWWWFFDWWLFGRRFFNRRLGLVFVWWWFGWLFFGHTNCKQHVVRFAGRVRAVNLLQQQRLYGEQIPNRMHELVSSLVV